MRFFKILIIVGFALTLIVSTSYAQKQEKIAFIDLSRLFDEHHKTADYDKVLEGRHQEFEKERNTKIEKIQESQGKLALLNADKKAELEAEIEKMKADLLEYDRQQKTTLTKERNEKIREILLEIEQQVSAYAEKEGYDLILNDRVLIYGNPVKDLTDEILTTLNANQPKK
ncbi:MAG TPA: OmpH family outer membrane protein [Candidatus Omnitrophota bacterium]|nr:OmpH family outer membrane protein [Candidatus Omnitrophota bacterium]